MKRVPLLLCVLFCCLPLAYSQPETPEAALARFDEAYRNRRDPIRARIALEGYRSLHQKQPERVELAWRLAMACQMVGHRIAKDPEEKASLFTEGKTAARAALERQPDCAPCHFWVAINMAQYAETVGVFKMLISLPEVRRHLKQAAESEPAYAFAGPYRILGLIDQKLPGIFGGDDDRARESFEKAIRLVPDNPMNYLFLARLLAENFHETEAALKIAREGLQRPPPPPHEIESVESREELAQFVLTESKK